MKKYAIVASLALVSGLASAADIAAPTSDVTGAVENPCTGTAGKFNYYGGPGAPIPTTVSISFIKTGFSIQCSANVNVATMNFSGTDYRVGSGSSKGNQSYRGSSNGGAVIVNSTCATSGCTSTDASAAASAASS